MQRVWYSFDSQDPGAVFRNMHTGSPMNLGSPELYWASHEVDAERRRLSFSFQSNEELTHERQPPHGGL